MKKAKYNEVPKDYRRNYKKEFVGFLAASTICLLTIIFIVLMIAWF